MHLSVSWNAALTVPRTVQYVLKNSSTESGLLGCKSYLLHSLHSCEIRKQVTIAYCDPSFLLSNVDKNSAFTE